MKFSSIHLKNFRGYENLDLELNPNFNLIIGDNGAGKTAILEAITVAMGSFFLGLKNVDSRHIQKQDIHIKSFNYNQEFQLPVIVQAFGEVMGEGIDWSRELNGPSNRTTSVKAEKIKKISKKVDKEVRKGTDIDLPVLAYYATGRLFDEARENKNSKDKKIEISSKFRAYNRCLVAKSTYKIFEEWFKGKELSSLQKGEVDFLFKLVKDVIIDSIPNCNNIYYEFDKDKVEGLKVELSDDRVLPFYYLSDGTRNFLALVADLGYKCVTLNPHLKEKALTDSSGVVLIDELDLHLHPEWQREIVQILKNKFPNIQFIVTSHSPFIIQETSYNQLINLKSNTEIEKGKGNNLSIEDIAEDIQGVENPQWSIKRQKMFELAKEYYAAVKEGTDTPEMKIALDNAMKPFVNDTAYYSILEQERILKENEKKK